MLLSSYLSLLTIDDVAQLEILEKQTRLSFWGYENYRRFLLEYPEYFGCKVVVQGNDAKGKLAGFLLARSLFDYLEVLKVGVSPTYQRQGIGTQLMDAAYSEGVERGCRRCFLEVRKSNEGAIQFYHTHRFRIAGTRLNYYTDPVEDAWIMERIL